MKLNYKNDYHVVINEFTCDLIIQKSQSTHKTD